MSTTSRILIAFLAFLAIGLYLFDRHLNYRVERQYLEAAEESMVDVAQLLAARLEGESFDIPGLRREWEAARQRKFSARIYDITKTTLDMNLYVTDAAGIVLFDSNGGLAEGQDYSMKRDVRLTLGGAYGARATMLEPPDRDSAIMYVSAPIRRDGRLVGVVSVAKAQRSLSGFRDQTRVWIRSVGLAYFGAVALGAYLVVRLFSRPIRRLTEYAQAVARGVRAAPPQGGSGEAATLGRAFEEMRDALENRAYVENYVQTVTHEMKSPVAAIRGAAELLHEAMPPERREKFVANIQAEARRLQNIIDRLLALSALESRKKLDHPSPVALADLAHGVCAQLQPAAEQHGLRIELRCEGEPRGARRILSPRKRAPQPAAERDRLLAGRRRHPGPRRGRSRRRAGGDRGRGRGPRHSRVRAAAALRALLFAPASRQRPQELRSRALLRARSRGAASREHRGGESGGRHGRARGVAASAFWQRRGGLMRQRSEEKASCSSDTRTPQRAAGLRFCPDEWLFSAPPLWEMAQEARKNSLHFGGRP